MVTSRGGTAPAQAATVGPTQTALYAPTYKQAVYEALRDMIIELEPMTRHLERAATVG